MPIENPRGTSQNTLTIENVVDFTEKYGDFFQDLPYRIYSSDRFDGNSDGVASDFDRLYSYFSGRMGRFPQQEVIAGVGVVGSREATVQMYHEQDGVSIRKGIQIIFQDDPTTIYFFGDGAHIVTVDPENNTVLTCEVKRDQDALQLMSDLLTA